MAKVSEFSDVQLEKLFIKYQTEYKKKPSDKVKKQLMLIQRERKKRKDEQTAQSDSASDLSKLIEHADVNTKKRKQKTKQKENKKLSNKLRKGSAPAISQMKTNIVLGLGLLFGLSGLILVLDCFVLYMLPTFSGKMIVGIILVLIGIGCSKAASFLSDDNR